MSDLTLFVENHGRFVVCSTSRPFRQIFAGRFAVTREVEPRIAHLLFEQVGHAGLVIRGDEARVMEHKRDLAAMPCDMPTVIREGVGHHIRIRAAFRVLRFFQDKIGRRRTENRIHEQHVADVLIRVNRGEHLLELFALCAVAFFDHRIDERSISLFLFA